MGVCDTLPLRSVALRNHWPALAPLGTLRFIESFHIQAIEPLAVTAFVDGILSAPPEAAVLDVGANMGVFTLIAAALNRSVVAVELQPGCRRCIRRHLAQLPAAARQRVAVVTGYVTAKATWKAEEAAGGVLVPRDTCVGMASPSAVLGRWPHGLATKRTRGFLASPPPANATRRAYPLVLARLLPGGADPIVAKIDVEGSEVHVLEALRPLWPRLHAVVLEVQPNAWASANVSAAEGDGTVRDLMRSQRMVAASLPHHDPRAPATRPRGAGAPMDEEAFVRVLAEMRRQPGRGGWYREYVLRREPR